MPSNFSLAKKGYDKEEVDSYIAKLEEVVKSYKEKDVAIKNAIVSAQVAADNIIKNAELQSSSYKLKTINELKEIQLTVAAQKNKLDSFQRDYNILMKKYIIEFAESDFSNLNEKIDSISSDLNEIQETLSTSVIKQDLSETKAIPTLRD